MNTLAEKDSKDFTVKRSLIKKYITDELYIELMKVTMMGDLDNNEKGTMIKTLLTKYNVPFSPLGNGTNRIGILIDGYAVKIAFDKDGMIDNRREFKYTKALQPYVIKVYECTKTGLIAVTEYITSFDYSDFQKYKPVMKEILSSISNQFLIGDVGITGKNYGNWGIRNDGTICILDFAYIYTVKSKIFTCKCDNRTILRYEDDFVMLHCKSCGRRYTFGEMRKKMSKARQEEEIGDITTIAYNISKPEEKVRRVLEYEPELLKQLKKEKKKEKTKEQLIIEKCKEARKAAKNQDWDYPELEREKSHNELEEVYDEASYDDSSINYSSQDWDYPEN